MVEGTGEFVEESNLLAVLQEASRGRRLVCHTFLEQKKIRTIFFGYKQTNRQTTILSSPAMMTLSFLAGPNFSVISCLCLWTAK